MRVIPLEVGARLTVKKPHPCGCCEWDVLRVGSDIRVRCTGCGRDVTIPREKLEKAIVRVQTPIKEEETP